MLRVLPFVSDFHPVWSPLAERIHAAVWKHVGLSTVQGLVQQWADEYSFAYDAAGLRKRVREEIVANWAESLGISKSATFRLLPDVVAKRSYPELPLPPDHDHDSLSLPEQWASLAAIHDVYWKDEKINPWPQPTDEDDPELSTWLSDVWNYKRLMEQVPYLAVEKHKAEIATRLSDVTTGAAQGGPQPAASSRTPILGFGAAAIAATKDEHCQIRSRRRRSKPDRGDPSPARR